jgi:hypothetical protein
MPAGTNKMEWRRGGRGVHTVGTFPRHTNLGYFTLHDSSVYCFTSNAPTVHDHMVK